MAYKIVLKPIRVSAGKYCWENKFNGDICDHFDNEGGHDRCSVGYYIENDGLHLKPKKCLELQEAS